jgi:gliding motility-associated-like protein
MWGFGDGAPVNTTENPTHTFLQPGSFTVALVVTTIHGCVDTIRTPVQVYSMPHAQFTVSDSNGCANYCPVFTDLSTTADGVITNWSWSFGDGTNSGFAQNPTHCYSHTGIYSITLTVTTSNGCVDTLTHVDFIHVYPVPNGDFNYSPNPITNLSPEVTFQDLSDASVWAWQWDFGDPNDPTLSLLQNPMHSYQDTGTFCVTQIVETIHHCKDTTVHCLRVDADFTFYIPNAFSPGTSLGKNDEFGGEGTFIKEYEMWIYDRWGNMIFYSNDLTKKWDGKPGHGTKVAQEDVYVYKVELTDVFGNAHRYTGTINLIR